MKKIIYIAEPEAINTELVRRLMPDDFELYAGSPDFSGQVPSGCTTLLIRSNVKVTKSIKDIFPDLTGIIRVGTGLDNVDMTYCDEEGIAVFNAPGANTDAVGDYVVCMALVALRKIHTMTRQDVETWNRFKFTGNNLSSQAIGIVGFGNIGRRVYRRLQAFGCNSFYIYDPYVKPCDLSQGVHFVESLNDMFEKCTVISLHLPLIQETKGLINHEKLNLLQPGSILLNSSRGEIVVEQDLISALKDNKFTYIADTVENEPNVASELLNNEKVIITPHIGSLTDESVYLMHKLAIENYLCDMPCNNPKQKQPALVRD